MKSALFLVIFVSILTLFSRVQQSRAAVLRYTVSAQVEAELRYSLKDNQVLISTNAPSGFFVSCRQIKMQVWKPEKEKYSLFCAANFILTTNF